MSTLSTHSPENLYSTQNKDNLKFNPKEIILSSLPCVASPRNKAIKVSLFDMVTGYTDEAKRGAFGIYRGTVNKAKKAKFKTHDVRAFTISIGFDGQPTGVLAVDIDHVSERYSKTTHEIIQLICQYFPVMVGATSFGGDGIFILMRYPKENNLVAVFKAIAEDFDMLLDIEIDFLADLQRLRIDTFDPEVFINWDAGIYDGIAIEETPAPATKEESNYTLDSRSPIGAVAFNNAGIKVFPIINPLMEGKGLTVTKANSKDEVYCYQAGGHSPRTIVAKFHEGIIFFIVKSSTFAKEWDIEEKGYNAYDWHKILTGFTDFDAQKELAKLGFGEFVEPQIKTNLQDANFRNKYRINVSEVIPPPQVALYINDEILGTLGNFSLITGKAKAKKSFLISMAVATALTDKVLHGILKSELPANQNQVLYFDTEQGKYHVQRAVKRICEQIGVAEPNNLHAFHLRSLTPSERLQFIEAEIYSNDGIGVVIIDGIKDLITSINDEGEATMIASKLLKWTEERSIHILTVLHQNKGDINARGHIGTELINKAETVLSVTVVEKDKEVSIVEAQQTRNREPQPFAFRIDENGIPFIISDYEATPIDSKISIVYRMQDLELYEILSEAFKDEKSIKYADLVRKVKEAYIRIKDSPLGDNKAKDLISICKGYNFITQSAEKQPYTLLPFTEITS